MTTTPLDESTVSEALDEVRVLVTADGADFELVGVDPTDAKVQLRLVLDGVECRECVLPRPMLEEMVTGMLRTSVPGVGSVSITDPRDND